MTAPIRVLVCDDQILIRTGLATIIDAPRDLEVLRLIASGLSNSEIAAALVISQETVKTYVSRILTKLDLRDRVQAVVLAYQTGVFETE